MWVCGLKQYRLRSDIFRYLVTPHVGVWIETFVANREPLDAHVTPHVGVWIETQIG